MNARALKDAAAKAFGEGKFLKAAELYSDVARLEPNEPRHVVRVGDSFRRCGRPDLAIDAYGKAAATYARTEQWLKAMSVCKLTLELEPHHARTLGLLVELNTRRMSVRTSGSFARPPELAALSRPPPPTPAPVPEVPEGPNTFAPADLDKDTTPAPEESAGGFEFELDLTPSQPPTAEQRSEAAVPVTGPAVPAVPWEPGDDPGLALNFSFTPEEIEAAAREGLPDVTADTDAEQFVVATARHALSRPATPMMSVIADSIPASAPAEVSAPDATPAAEPASAPVPGAADLLKPVQDFSRQRIPLLSGLPQPAFLDLLRRVELRFIRADETIVHEGDAGTSLFIVVSGRARVVKRQKDGIIELGTFEEGAFFGEMALLNGDRRAASVIATEDCDLLEIDQQVLQELATAYPEVGVSIARFYRDRLFNRVNLISPLFRAFPPEDRPRVAAQFGLREAAPDEVLIREGQAGDGLYVVVTGTALVTKLDASGNNRPLNVLSEGDVFGEISLLSGQPATATVTAKRRMILLVLPRALFRHVVDAFPQVLETALELWKQRAKRDRDFAAQGRDLGDLRKLALRL